MGKEQEKALGFLQIEVGMEDFCNRAEARKSLMEGTALILSKILSQ